MCNRMPCDCIVKGWFVGLDETTTTEGPGESEQLPRLQRPKGEEGGKRVLVGCPSWAV
jgi:hypothetical protein